MIKYISTFLVGLFILGCGNTEQKTSNTITLKGHVQFPETDTDFGLVLSKIGVDNTTREIQRIELDSTNNYTMNLSVDTIGFYEINVYKTNSVQFYADDEDLTINFRGIDTARIKMINPPYIHIKGGPKNNVLNQVHFELYQNYQDGIAIGQQQYKASLSNSDAWKEHATTLWEDLGNDFDNRIKHIIQTFEDYPTVVKAVDLLSWRRDQEMMLKYYGKLASDYPELAFIQKRESDLKEKITNDLRMAVGNVAPDFTFPNMEGSEVTLSEFRGKYVLIDFWASWCGPCRQETPHVQKMYSKYKEDLELVTVSIDTDVEEWTKAVEEDQMDGQLLIAQDFKEIQKSYVFSGIPYMVLIDREGRILGKNLRGESLENKLKEFLD